MESILAYQLAVQQNSYFLRSFPYSIAYHHNIRGRPKPPKPIPTIFRVCVLGVCSLLSGDPLSSAFRMDSHKMVDSESGPSNVDAGQRASKRARPASHEEHQVCEGGSSSSHASQEVSSPNEIESGSTFLSRPSSPALLTPGTPNEGSSQSPIGWATRSSSSEHVSAQPNTPMLEDGNEFAGMLSGAQLPATRPPMQSLDRCTAQIQDDLADTPFSSSEDDASHMLAFAMGMHSRLGSNSLVRVLNSNVVQSILCCELTVGPTRHFSSLRNALASGQAACATVVRVNVEPGVHKMDIEAEVTEDRRILIRPTPGSEPGSVVLSSTTGRPLLRVASPRASVEVRGLAFAFKTAQSAATDLKQRCIWVTEGAMLLKNCSVSSDAGIGVCVLRNGVVRCEGCDLSDCGFVGVASAQGGRAEITKGCRIRRNRHFGVLSTDAGSCAVVRDSELCENGTYGVGVGAGAKVHAQATKLERNQVGIVSKGAGSHVVLSKCQVSANVRMGLGVREGATAEAVECKMQRNQYGLCVSNTGSKVTLSGCELDDNVTHGLGASEGGAIEAAQCAMRRNQVGVVSKGAGSSVVLSNCKASDNGRIGVGIREGGSATATRCEMRHNQYGVCALNAGAVATLKDCDASHNERYGISSSDGGVIEGVGCRLNHNLQLGIGAWHAGSRISLVRCVANCNGRTGLAARVGASITAAECTLKRNAQFGVYVSGAGSHVRLADSLAGANGLYGLGASEGGVAEVHTSRMERNQQAGVVSKDAGSRIALWQSEASENGRIGVAAIVGGAVEAHGCSMRRNERVGMGSWNVGSRVSLEGCAAVHNGATGLTAIEGGQLAAQRCVVSHNGRVGVVAKDGRSTVTLRECTASDNGRIGVGARGLGQLDAVLCTIERNQQSGAVSKDAGSRVTIADSRINDNGRYGLSVREGGVAELRTCAVQGNQHMGVCVWNAASAVSLWSCNATGNGHHALGARDGSVIHCYGHTQTEGEPEAGEDALGAPPGGLEAGSRHCSGLDGLDDMLPVDAVASMAASSELAAVDAAHESEVPALQQAQSLGVGFLEALLQE